MLFSRSFASLVAVLCAAASLRAQDAEITVRKSGFAVPPEVARAKVAFVATRTGKKEIYTCNGDGSGLQQLTNDGAISVGPALSPDGRRLAYTGYQSGYANTSASYNHFDGYQAGRAKTTGHSNHFVGYLAGDGGALPRPGRAGRPRPQA